MSAKEMFEQLGYECERKKFSIEYVKKGVFTKRIYFYKADKVLAIECTLCADMNLFKAIHKQIEELGWLDE